MLDSQKYENTYTSTHLLNQLKLNIKHKKEAKEAEEPSDKRDTEIRELDAKTKLLNDNYSEFKLIVGKRRTRHCSTDLD